MRKATKPYREERRTFLIPLHGVQKFELENLDSKSRYVRVNLFSSRFTILESRREGSDKFEFIAYLDGFQSIVFSIFDRGHVDEKKELLSYNYEGVLRVFVSKKETVEGVKLIDTYCLPDCLVTSDPETDSYREFRDKKDRNARWFDAEDEPNPLNDILSLEPLDDDKYQKGYPENVRIQKLTSNEKMVNSIKERNLENRISMHQMRQKQKEEEMKIKSEKFEKSEVIEELKSPVQEETPEKPEKSEKVSETESETSAEPQSHAKKEEVKKANHSISHKNPQKSKTKRMKKNKKKCVIS